MNRLSLISLGLLSLLSATTAACLPGASMDKEKLVNTASFDHGCPREKIDVVMADDHGMDATGNYLLKVCGSDKRYKRMGTIYYDADKPAPVPTK